MGQIFAYIVHKDGVLDDTAMELVNAARKFSDDPVTAIVCGSGIDSVASEAAKIYPEVIKIDNEAFAYPNAEAIRKALVNILPADAVILIANDTFAMDLAPGLSVKLDSAYISDVVDIEGADGDLLKTVRQEFGGEVSTHVTCDISSGAIVNIRPGAISADDSKAAAGNITDKSAEAGDVACGRKFLEVVVPEAGDVDITKADVLLSIGRGIEDEDNIEIAQELADAMGAVLSCSRPIVDAKWLDPSRQVGTSGKTVKPKVYMACGISGSFQHLGGIKGGFVVAINKNPNAPIFQVANVGIVADILEFMPELQEAIEEL